MAKRMLTLNIGSSEIALGEFEMRGGGLELARYAIAPLGLEPGKDSDPSAYIVSTIRDILRHNNIRAGPVMVSISGKDIFPRYVKLPPVTSDKVGDIVYYEAQQNVPFPIEEVVWDYQLIDNDDGSKSVMLVAVKQEVVKKLVDSVVAAGLDPVVVDVAPMTLYNLCRFTYGDLDGCTLIIDMGARSTNVVFVEQKKIFCRSIPLAGHAITQEVMKELDLSFKEAEEVKIAHAFVAFGGVVEGSDSPVVNRVSKIVRGIMTKLHAELTRSINFYRSQQNGSKPPRLLLCGGSSIMPATDSFLKEKLGIEVEYMNPFLSVAIANRIPAEEIAGKMHLLGEVTGLALRWAYSCPMEIDLMPPENKARKRLKARMPFFIAAAAAVILSVVCLWGYTWRLRIVTERYQADLKSRLDVIDNKQAELSQIVARERAVQDRIDQLLRLIGLRTRWLELVGDIRASLLDGMWITKIEPIIDPEGGKIRAFTIEGMGFLDKVKDAVAIGQFAETLGKTRYFGEVKVDKTPPRTFVIEFNITANLKEPWTF
ncbi:MAG: type IV pilus assembly protein PilM [bacterium]